MTRKKKKEKRQTTSSVTRVRRAASRTSREIEPLLDVLWPKGTASVALARAGQLCCWLASRYVMTPVARRSVAALGRTAG